MKKEHQYEVFTEWTGNTGSGTSTPRGYERSLHIDIPGKIRIPASSDTAFNADKSKHNPEDLLVAALSSCHMLTYLYLCSLQGIEVVQYSDRATGVMLETIGGAGQFTSVTLHPTVVVRETSMVDLAQSLHHEAGKTCYIARSVNFPVMHEATCEVKQS